MRTDQISALLIALAVIALLARPAGALARRLGQPPVVGEIVLGVLLGPTLLHGQLAQALFPTGIRPFLTAFADVGVAMFMFLVGLEVDAALLRGRRFVSGGVALGSIALPFAFGVVLAYRLYHRHPTGNHLAFVLFLGAAMSVTAFPVLARILADRGLSRTRLGTVALACAALDDVLAWMLLAVVVAISGAGGGMPWKLLLLAPYAALLTLVVRPLLARWLGAGRADRSALLVVILAGVLLSAAATEWMGLHFIFGAFLFGAITPRTPASAAVVDRVQPVNAILLMPVFFVVAGLNVDLSHLDTTGLGELLLILLAAVGGKFCGAFLAARLSGLDSRFSATLAVLMNTRGLTELIILTVGLQIGVIDRDLYSWMVVMALVTTAMAGPALQLLRPARLAEADRAPEPVAAVPETG